MKLHPLGRRRNKLESSKELNSTLTQTDLIYHTSISLWRRRERALWYLLPFIELFYFISNSSSLEICMKVGLMLNLFVSSLRHCFCFFYFLFILVPKRDNGFGRVLLDKKKMTTGKSLLGGKMRRNLMMEYTPPQFITCG